MNWLRIFAGPLLAFIFLLSFTYVINGARIVFNNYSDGSLLLGSVSDGLKNTVEAKTEESQIEDIVLPSVDAKSAISVESDLRGLNKVIFSKDAATILPIASLTKLMTAMVVLDNYRLSDIVTVSKDADSQVPMKEDVKFGDTMPVENFLDVMLVGSSNRSAYTLSEGPGGYLGMKKFVELMNIKARNLGLANTSFVEPTGLSPNNKSTASDLEKLAETILKDYPKIANITKEKQFYVPGFGNVSNTDQLLAELPDAICSKTGFTTAAKGCLLLVVNNQKNNDYIINVVLGADDRFAEMKKIINFCQ